MVGARRNCYPLERHPSPLLQSWDTSDALRKRREKEIDRVHAQVLRESRDPKTTCLAGLKLCKARRGKAKATLKYLLQRWKKLPDSGPSLGRFLQFKWSRSCRILRWKYFWWRRPGYFPRNCLYSICVCMLNWCPSSYLRRSQTPNDSQSNNRNLRDVRPLVL